MRSKGLPTEKSEEPTTAQPAQALQVVAGPVPGPATFAGVNIEGLMSKAIDAKSAVEVLERLMVLRREAQAEQAKREYDLALAEFQADCPVIQKSEAVSERKDPGKVRYRYAPLDVIVSQVKELLRKHGFSYDVDAKVEDRWVTAILTVKHKGGHSEKKEFRVPIDPESYMNAPQKFASALTFAKRYVFCNGFGILTGDQDDDAQGADRHHAAGQGRRPAENEPSPSATTKPKAPPSRPAGGTASRTDLNAGGYRRVEPDTLRELRGKIGSPAFEENLIRFLREAQTARGRYLLMPNEGLEDLGQEDARHLILRWDEGLATIEQWIAEHPNQAPPAGTDASEQPWYNAVVPIPRKGMKRDEYMKKPDTLGSLWEVRKTDEAARSRLFGLADHFQVETQFIGREGKAIDRKPEDIARDEEFAAALDEFAAWHKKHTEEG